MKRVFCIIITFTILLCTFSGCGSNNTTNTTITKSAAQIEQEEFTQAKEKVINQLKSILKNPESLQVHDVHYKNTPPTDEFYQEYDLIDMDCKFAMAIDYSAQNGFGGMNRSTIYAIYSNDGTVSLANEEDGMSKEYLTYCNYSYVEK